jgi:hypothetical protein
MSFQHLVYVTLKISNTTMEKVDLTGPCDACGKQPVGGGAHCPKCNIHFCFTCMVKLIYLQKKLPLRCPMCDEKLS